MSSDNVIDFQTFSEKVGRFDVGGRTLVLPEMAKMGSRVLAATFRGFGVNAKVMDTCKGLDLGKKYTSGKECYPCQITTGDILYFMKRERERLGDNFSPEDYIYFMPEAEGPCRFGMYNKYQRIVLDSFPELRSVRIGSITTGDSYALTGIIEKEKVRDLRKIAYFCVVVTDILDRLLWRIRPYEKEAGITDAFITRAMHEMESVFETHAGDKNFAKILDKLEEIIKEGKGLIDPNIPPKPLIGVVGEIYLRTHIQANQDLIRVLERYGAEIVNASIAEWVNYTTYDGLRTARKEFLLSLRQLRIRAMRRHLEKIMDFGAELIYQQFRQRQGYNRARAILDLAEDHRVSHLEGILEKEKLYSFEAGTEACLSIPGILGYAREGYNGIVNVYPFTCMPSTITSAIVRPVMNRLRVPYLDAPYDSGRQPGRETAIRTFMYQAQQHLKRRGRRSHSD